MIDWNVNGVFRVETCLHRFTAQMPRAKYQTKNVKHSLHHNIAFVNEPNADDSLCLYDVRLHLFVSYEENHNNCEW